MSLAATHEGKDARRRCESCRVRKARFQSRGRVRADRHHTLCFECFRSERDRQRARRMADGASPAPIRAPFGEPCRSLNSQELAHRWRMLAHLNAAAR